MHKIGDDTTTADVNDEFTEGTPGVDPATIVKANWLNALQRELINLLTQASITPNNATYNQVYAALQVLFPQFDDLATTSLAGIIELSTDAEAIAKALGTRALTPLNLAALGSSTTFAGLIEEATDAEALAMSLVRAVTCSNLAALVASNAEVLAHSINNKFLTPIRHGESHGRGALVYRSTAQSIPDVTTTAINWDSEVEDTDTIHDNATNNNRLTVPTGVTKVKLSANIAFASNSTGFRDAFIYKNGAIFNGFPHDTRAAVNGSSTVLNITSGNLVVAGGDYFDVRVYQNSGGALNISGSELSWFAMDIVK